MSAAVELVDQLAAQETIIRRSLSDASAALATIRDQRLYRAGGFDNFDAYCRSRLGHGRDRADQIIAAGRTLAALPTNVGNGLNEAQVRALAPYRDAPDLMAEVLAVVGGGGAKITAAAITAEITRRQAEAQKITDELDALCDGLLDSAERLIHGGYPETGRQFVRELQRMLTDPEHLEEHLAGQPARLATAFEIDTKAVES